MNLENDTQKLDRAQLDHVLAILKRENQDIPLTEFQRTAFKLLNFGFYGYVGLWVLLINLAALGFWLWEDLAGVSFFGMIVLTALGLVVGLGLAALFVLNLPLIWRIFSYRKAIRRLGLTRALDAPYQIQRRKHRLINRATFAIACLGLVIILISIASGWWLWSWKPLLLITLGVAAIGMHLLRQGKARIDSISLLRNSLPDFKAQAERAEAAQVAIPMQAYEQIAKLERAQIIRDRLQTIQSYQQSGESSYVIQKSHQALADLARLDPLTRARVQNEMDTLAEEEPDPAGAGQDTDSGVRRLAVQGTRVQVDYEVDSQENRIRILSVRPEDGSPDIEGGA